MGREAILRMSLSEWLMPVIGFAAVSFLIPFVLVHAIAWVVRGFKK
jgi:hypothetical protein